MNKQDAFLEQVVKQLRQHRSSRRSAAPSYSSQINKAVLSGYSRTNTFQPSPVKIKVSLRKLSQKMTLTHALHTELTSSTFTHLPI